MTIFQELDAYLSLEFSDDAWGDWYESPRFYAYELIERLTAEDWDILRSSWRDRSKQWQKRCAEVLSKGNVYQAIPLLLEMIEAKDDRLTITAAISLDFTNFDKMVDLGKIGLPISANVLLRLEVMARSSCVSKVFIDSLVRKLIDRLIKEFEGDHLQLLKGINTIFENKTL